MRQVIYSRAFLHFSSLLALVTPLVGQSAKVEAPQCEVTTGATVITLNIPGSGATPGHYAWDSEGFPFDGAQSSIALSHSQWDEGVFHVRAIDLTTSKVACETTVTLQAPVSTSGEKRVASRRPGEGIDVTTVTAPRVPVYFATERELVGGAELFGNARSGDLKVRYGIISVGVSAPNDFLLRANSNLSYDDKLFTHADIKQWGEAGSFYNALGPLPFGTQRQKGVLLYVHGFNNGFNEAVNKTAQLVVDTGFQGKAVVFDWPATQTRFGADVIVTYPKDRTEVDSSTEHLATLITQLVNLFGKGNVHIIAHSLGNRVFMNALTLLLASGKPIGLGQVILAAPDLDGNLFRSNIDRLIAGNADGVTMYGSRRDKAMWASRAFNHTWPVGTLDPIYPIRNLVQVDASGVSANFLGHDYFVTAAPAIRDIRAVLSSPSQMPPRGLKMSASRGYTFWLLQQ